MTNRAPPAWCYDARTVHMRFAPFQRRFSYRLFQVCLDVDRVEEVAARLALFSYNGWGLFSFHDVDHGDRSGAPLRAWAERGFAAAGVALEGGPIRLICFPRFLGYVFNPISLFIGYGPDGSPRGVIYAVNNTFGERHAYVALLTGEGLAAHEAAKRLHVSPFFDVAGQYHFKLVPPDDRLHLVVENWVEGARTHVATLVGRRRALTDVRLALTAMALPFMTLGVTAAIHWQALFIWMKRAGYRRKPTPPSEPFSLAS